MEYSNQWFSSSGVRKGGTPPKMQGRLWSLRECHWGGGLAVVPNLRVTRDSEGICYLNVNKICCKYQYAYTKFGTTAKMDASVLNKISQI